MPTSVSQRNIHGTIQLYVTSAPTINTPRHSLCNYSNLLTEEETVRDNNHFPWIKSGGPSEYQLKDALYCRDNTLFSSSSVEEKPLVVSIHKQPLLTLDFQFVMVHVISGI